MKCPERYKITQVNKTVYNNEDVTPSNSHLLVENQDLEECYGEECAAWDNENKVCRKVRD